MSSTLHTILALAIRCTVSVGATIYGLKTIGKSILPPHITESKVLGYLVLVCVMILLMDTLCQLGGLVFA